MSDLVLVDRREGWTELTLNRPQVLNALNRELLRALDEAIHTACDDPDCHALILTGAGERAFAAGADVAEMHGLAPGELPEFLRLGQGIPLALESVRQPVIAAVNGYALGGGCEVALGCDVILASETAQFGQPEVTLGILPGWGGTQRLPRRVGLGRARELIFTGRRVAAEEALRIGLADRVLPAATLMPEARSLAAGMAANPVAVAAAKEALRAAADLSLRTGCAHEARLFSEVFRTEERRTAMGRFLERE